MNRSTRFLTGLTAFAIAAAPILIGAPATAARDYPNCKALNADYRHGVGKPGAVDSTSKKPVTTFTVNATVYKANSGLDRDGDGIACEKR